MEIGCHRDVRDVGEVSAELSNRIAQLHHDPSRIDVADIVVDADDQFTPLMAASWLGDCDVARSLLEMGAKIDAVSIGLERTALMAAGDTVMAGFPLENHALIEMPTGSGDTAFLLACKAGKMDMARLLCYWGADIHKRNRRFMNAFMYACENGHVELIDFLVSNRIDVNAENIEGNSPLLFACKKNFEPELIEHILASGADESIDRADVHGTTPLIAAIERGAVEVVKLLLRFGARANATMARGKLVSVASGLGREDIASLLREHDVGMCFDTIPRRECAGILPERENQGDGDRDRRDERAHELLDACVRGRADLVEEILSFHMTRNLAGDLDTLRNGADKTALILASERGFDEIVRLLLRHGAKPDVHPRARPTALMVATQRGFPEVVDALLGFGAKPNISMAVTRMTALMMASERGSDEIATDLLRHGADPNLRTNTGKTALMLACEMGSVAVVRYLLDHGAEVNAQTMTGITPLMYASMEKMPEGNSATRQWQRQLEIRRMLLQCGAQLDTQAHDGCTMLMLAAKTGPLTLVQTLLDRKADPTLKAINGSTAYMHATDPAIKKELQNARIKWEKKANRKRPRQPDSEGPKE